MKRYRIILPTFLILTALAGIALAQSTGRAFEPIRQFGEPRPQSIHYNRPLDQFLWVAPGGELQLVDAASYTVQHTLYSGQTYKATAFSDDGSLLAVAIDLRVDLWNPDSGTLLTSFEPEGIWDLQGPLQFADDNALLVVNSVVPAPQELRRSENDTVILPWLWDIPNALGTGRSALPNRADAYAYFEYRNGFTLGYADKVISGRPGRLEVLDVSSDETNVVLAEIESDRLERDPINVWRSQIGDYLYVQPAGRRFTQINTTDGSFLPIEFGLRFDETPDGSYARDLYQRMVLEGYARPLGSQSARTANTLASRLLDRGDLGIDYVLEERNAPVSVQLVDVLEPITSSAEYTPLIVYVYNQDTATGRVERVFPANAQKVAVSPSQDRIAFYYNSGLIEVFDVFTGDLLLTFEVAYPDHDGRAVFDFDPTGQALVYDFQRFDASTGEVLLEDLNINTGFDDFYFSQDGSRLITFNNNDDGSIDWWQWEIATGEVMRRERFTLRGDLRATWYTGERFLSTVSFTELGESKTAILITDVANGDLRQLTFENFPERTIQQIIHSPDWERALVVYTSPYHGTEYALYSFANGFERIITAEDTPQTAIEQVYWADNERIVLYTNQPDTLPQANVVYGLQYDVTGLPLCLRESFREDFERWLPIWERRVNGLNERQLINLTLEVCDALPAAVETVDEILTTPTPTRAPTQAARFAPTAPVLANVPECLTRGVGGQNAQQYAEVWRAISVGLTPQQAQELSRIVCEGLTTANTSGIAGDFGDSRMGGMIINVTNGVREYTRDVPASASAPNVPYRLDIIRREYERAYNQNRTIERGRISPDGQLLARSVGPYISLERINKPYGLMAAEVTGTALAIQQATESVVSISLRPTITPSPQIVGFPRPTVTPTITPTSPPRPAAENIYPAPQLGQVTDVCDVDAQLYTLDNPPPAFPVTGSLFVNTRSLNGSVRFDPQSGYAFRDRSIPACYAAENCDLSYNGQWLLNAGETPTITRADGTDTRILVDFVRQSYPITSINWIVGTNRVQFLYMQPRENNVFRTWTYVREYDPETDTMTDPMRVRSRERVEVNELPTESISVQPLDGQWEVLRTSFNTGRGIGYKYYMLDRTTEEITYFARTDQLEANNAITFIWEQLGRTLFYRYPNSTIWYAFDPITADHYVYGTEPYSGDSSPDGRYRIEWRTPRSDEIREREEAGLPIPVLYLWDVETGGLRRYCIPEGGLEMQRTIDAIIWSPDSRFITFQMRLPASYFDDSPTPIPGTTPTPFYGVRDREPEYLAQFTRLYLLDLQTGYVTEVDVNNVTRILNWVEVNE